MKNIMTSSGMSVRKCVQIVVLVICVIIAVALLSRKPRIYFVAQFRTETNQLPNGTSTPQNKSTLRMGLVNESMKAITVACKGRLGNLLFMYAAVLGIAKRNQMLPVYPSGLDINDTFNLQMTPLNSLNLNSFGKFKDHREYGRRSGAYDKTTETLAKENVNIRLLGYYQSWKYFDNVQEELRRHLAFRLQVEKAAKGYLQRLLRQNYSGTHYVKVGVHVRRGDMARKRQEDFGYKTADPKYIYRAMNYFRQKFKSVLFIICTNDVKWCKEHVKATDVVFSEGNDKAVDLAILASCQHIVMTVGSYGWWAAWLANGTTVYLKNWPRPKSRLDRKVEKADYFPPHWIPM